MPATLRAEIARTIVGATDEGRSELPRKDVPTGVPRSAVLFAHARHPLTVMSTAARDPLDHDPSPATPRSGGLDAAYDAAPVGLCVLDSALRYTRVNSTLARMHGVAAVEHIGRPIGAVVSWLAPVLEPLAREVLDTGVTILRRSLAAGSSESGHDRRWEISLSPVRAADGRTVEVSGVVEDVSDRVAPDLGLFAAVVQASPEAIVSLTTDGVIASWNDAAERLLGYTAAEIVGQLASGLAPRDRSDEWVHFLGLARHGGAILNFETVWLRKDGTPVEVALAANAVLDDTGTTTALSLIVRNATERRQIEETATAVDRRQDELLALLGHELRGPLGVIMQAASLPGSGESDEHRRIREIIGQQARHLSRVIDDLIEMERMASGKLDLGAELVDLREVARQSVARCAETQLEHHEMSVSGVPTWVEGDPLRLEQACVALLDTAVKHRPPAGKIELTVEPINGAAVLRIADAPMGAPSSEVASSRVRDLFGADIGPAGGEQLELAAAKRVIEMHGGSVTATNGDPGRAREFIVRLPLHTGPITSPAHIVFPADTSAVRRVLVIEDDHAARETLRLVLEDSGHRLEEAEDGRAGLEKLGDLRPDICLIDVGLPGVDGYEVARRARARPETRNLYLVALTDDTRSDSHRVAIDAGFDRVLTKPVDWELLQRLMAEAPNRARRPR
jgi:PAS domain S-box-containing protein